MYLKLISVLPIVKGSKYQVCLQAKQQASGIRSIPGPLGAHKSEEGQRKSLPQKDPPSSNSEAPSPWSGEAELEGGRAN